MVHTTASLARLLLGSPINALLVAAPISWWLHAAAPESPWTFLSAAVSLVPLAGLIGLGTEQLAERSGPVLGGFLNATFGNAAELIIAIVALNGGHVALVQASITGSILGNLLLVLGLSFLVGGLRHRRTQKFHRTAANNMSAMLFLAVVALVMPAVFDLSLYGNLAARPPALTRLSFLSSIVLIIAYAGSLVYAFTANQDLFRSSPADPKHALLPVRVAVGVLALATILTTIQAEMLVSTMEPALRRFGFTEFFVGVIVVAIIGNAAEHYSAVAAARRDQMTLAVEISVGSSAQIALLVAPAVVLYSFAIGQPMTLLFDPFEISAIALSVLATVIVVVDGESNWVEGLQLLAVYVILGIAFYFVP
jgi:Ca2+:H+ antiporter